MHAFFVSSSIQPYLPVEIAVSFCLEVAWGVPLPYSPMERATLANVTTFPSPRLLGRCCHSCLLQQDCLFTLCMRECPPPLPGAQGTLPSLLHVYLFFSLGKDQSVQEAMLICPRVVCGIFACCLAHLVVCFSQAV
jgi:hypothetical protein